MSGANGHHDAEGIDLMAADVERQAEVLAETIPALRAAAADVAGKVGQPPTRAFLIGCGDSLDAGIAARYVWEPLLGIPVEAVPAMTFATSVAPLAPAGSLVVALSQSGKVSRTVEGVRAARGRGLATVTITANGSSALAQEPADATWVIDFEKLGAIPGTTSHLVGAAAIYELGAAFTPSAGATALRGDLDALPDAVREAIDAAREPVTRQVEALSRELPFIALGFGAVLSSARFTVRKLLELTQIVALWQETEEYAHDEYSLVDERFRTMLFAPPKIGEPRSIEIARYLRRLGVHLTVVTAASSAGSYEAWADEIIAIPDVPRSVVPLVYTIPGQLLSIGAARRLGGSLYGMAERVHREDGDPQIYESEIVTA